MEYTISSKRLGKNVTFFAPRGSYIFVDLNGKPGSLGWQICKGGELMGSTISLRSDDWNEFTRICKRWFRQYLTKHAPEAIGI